MEVVLLNGEEKSRNFFLIARNRITVGTFAEGYVKIHICCISGKSVSYPVSRCTDIDFVQIKEENGFKPGYFYFTSAKKETVFFELSPPIAKYKIVNLFHLSYDVCNLNKIWDNDYKKAKLFLLKFLVVKCKCNIVGYNRNSFTIEYFGEYEELLELFIQNDKLNKGFFYTLTKVATDDGSRLIVLHKKSYDLEKELKELVKSVRKEKSPFTG